MAFSFECPHCSQSFEADLELCGSTCNCPSCGGLFLVPEVDTFATDRTGRSEALPAAVSGGLTQLEVDAIRAEAGRLEADFRSAAERWDVERGALARRCEETEALLQEARSELGAGTARMGEMRAEQERVSKELSLLSKEKDRLGSETARELAASRERIVSLEAEHAAAKVRAEQADARLKGPSEEVVRLRAELDRVAAEKAAHEKAAAQEKKASQERITALEAEHAAAKARAEQVNEQLKEQLKGPSEEVVRLRGELDRVAAENAAHEKAAAQEKKASQERITALEAEREAAKVRAEQAAEKLQGPAAEVARLRTELDRIVSEKAALEALSAKERGDFEERCKRLEGERDAERSRVERALGEQNGTVADLEKVRGELERLHKDRSKVESDLKDQLKGFQERLGAAEAERNAERGSFEKAGNDAKSAAAEVARLRVEVERLAEEKSASGVAFGHERTRLEGRLNELEREREIALRRAEQTDSGTKALSTEIERLLGDAAVQEKRVSQEREHLEVRLREAEKERDSAMLKEKEAQKLASGLKANVETLSGKVEALSKKRESIPLTGKDGEIERLRLQLESKDAEISMLAEQVRATAMKFNEPPPVENWFASALRKREPVLWLTLLAGVTGGLSLARVISPREKASSTEAQITGGSASAVNPALAEPSVTAQKASATEGTQAEGAGAPGVSTQSPGQPQQAAQASSQPGATAGMPGRLPDAFLGIRFGSPLADLAGRGQWQETGGNRHRKADLLGAPVEAVLTPDDQGRLVMGSYIRVVGRQVEALSPFLEWAVNAQDAVSALYGEPSRIHQIEGASDPVEVVRKIASGEDFYEASWEREGEDTMMDLSIRVFNERSVVFRLEYRSRELAAAFAERQAAAQKAASQRPAEAVGKAPEAGGKPAETGPEKTAEEAPK